MNTSKSEIAVSRESKDAVAVNPQGTAPTPADRILTIRYNPLTGRLPPAEPTYRVVEPHGDVMATGLTKREADNIKGEADSHEFTVELEGREPLDPNEVHDLVIDALGDAYITATITEREVPDNAHSELVSAIEYGVQAADAVMAQWNGRTLTEADKNLIQWAEDAIELADPLYLDPRIEDLTIALTAVGVVMEFIIKECGERVEPTGTLGRIAHAAHHVAARVDRAVGEVHPDPLDHDTKLKALRRMEESGGHFAGLLAAAWMRADSVNAARLDAAFGDILRTYL